MEEVARVDFDSVSSMDKLCADFREQLELHWEAIERTLMDTDCERPISLVHKIGIKPDGGEGKPFRTESTTEVKLLSPITVREAKLEHRQLELL